MTRSQWYRWRRDSPSLILEGYKKEEDGYRVTRGGRHRGPKRVHLLLPEVYALLHFSSMSSGARDESRERVEVVRGGTCTVVDPSPPVDPG